MDYEKKYKEILNRAAIAYKDEDKHLKATLERIFPELKEKENEDEKISKELIKLLRNLFNNYSYFIKDPFYTECIAWLEKQGEQKSANMVEPKFHIGDWVMFNNKHQSIYQVERIEDGYYILRHTHGGTFRVCVLHDESLRLWTIQDAKDGDVLYSLDSKQPFIFKHRKANEQAEVYCGINIYGKFFARNTKDCIITADKYVPATKEQRGQLEKAMANAGYTFDFDKKEVKEIEDEIEIPFGAKDSELHEVTYFIPQGFHAEIEGDKVVIKKGEKPTDWSEEDEENFRDIIGALHNVAYQTSEDEEVRTDWIKSIKQRIGWKPSKNQVDAFEHLVRSVGESGYASPYDINTKLLYSLLEQLKKLRD